jgi:hypothetical protein
MPNKKKPEVEIPNIVKVVYNDHLAFTRGFHHKPFRIKKNFKGFAEDSRYRHYLQLAMWFDKHPEINRRLYFEAALYFNRDISIIPISNYCHPKGLTYYTKYVKVINCLNLDDPKSLKGCIEGFKFIRKFCRENGIKVSDYVNHFVRGNATYSCIIHVKRGDVCIYSLFAFHNFKDVLKSLYKDRDVWEFYIGDNTPLFLSQRYLNSVKYQTLATKAKIQTQLTNICQTKQ